MLALGSCSRPPGCPGLECTTRGAHRGRCAEFCWRGLFAAALACVPELFMPEALEVAAILPATAEVAEPQASAATCASDVLPSTPHFAVVVKSATGGAGGRPSQATSCELGAFASSGAPSDARCCGFTEGNVDSSVASRVLKFAHTDARSAGALVAVHVERAARDV